MTQHMQQIIYIVLKLFSLAVIILAAGFWAGSSVDTRPKYRDEQTLVGGTIWSQLIIPIGQFISMLVGQPMNVFVYGYFQLTGMILCYTTAFVLIYGECITLARHGRNLQRTRRTVPENRSVVRTVSLINRNLEYDKYYTNIGVLTLIAGILKAAQFVLFLMLDS